MLGPIVSNRRTRESEEWHRTAFELKWIRYQALGVDQAKRVLNLARLNRDRRASRARAQRLTGICSKKCRHKNPNISASV